jgi:hypothetical protein
VEFTSSLEIDFSFGRRSGLSGRRRQCQSIPVPDMLDRDAEKQGAEEEYDEFDLVPGEPH